jgi:hypothetical protein
MKEAMSALKTEKVEALFVICSLSGVGLGHAHLDFEFCPYNFRKSRTIVSSFIRISKESDTIVFAMRTLVVVFLTST